ncbi:MAG: sigma-54 dependent transcriptional regulator [Gammaproteobacteria bacterium]|nr:sigma-54 dependent transcriptional regulator [Gammaproteobacteria bacterium]
MAHVLLIERNPDTRTELARVLESNGFTITEHGSPGVLDNQDLSAFDSVVASTEVLERPDIFQQLATLPLILLSDKGTVREAVDAIKQGAADYLELPVEPDELVAAIERARAALQPRATAAPETRKHFPIIGSSSAMCELLDRIDKVAPTDATVLIEGESGTGKELVARALHAGSLRNLAALITLNCAAVPDNLIETELFGHETPDASVSSGLVEAADGGTLFLDEIGELPLEAQARLLRLLQKGETRRIGSSSTKVLNVRIIAASHRNLKQLTENRQFREDLFYRLNVVAFVIPPLRERGADIVELAHHALKRVCDKLGKAQMRLSSEALKAIQTYRWPGNVRELENAMERAVILCDGEEIDVKLLAIDPTAPVPEEDSPPANVDQVSLEDYFVRFVQEHQDRLTETELAGKLGISRKSLWERRQRLNIPRKKTKKRGPRRQDAN